MTEILPAILLAAVAGFTIFAIMRPQKEHGDRNFSRLDRRLLVNEMASVQTNIYAATHAMTPRSRAEWLTHAILCRLRVERMVHSGFRAYTTKNVDIDVATLIGVAYARSVDLRDWKHDLQRTLESFKLDDRGNWSYWIRTERIERTGSRSIVYVPADMHN